MNLKSLFRKTNKREEDDVLNLEPRPEVPEGLYVKCNKCGATVSSKEMSKALKVCPKCGQYNPLSASERIKLVTDKGSFKKFNFGIEQKNPLNVEGYPEKLEKAKKATGLDEAVVSGYCKIGGLDAVIAVMDGRFMMASMGSFVGEHLARTIDEATTKKLPLVIFAASGGARMQEGIVSLMQMAKTSAAIKKHKEAGLLYISVLTDPTTGGVTASFASLGDIILAEPKALIGFAGPRVIEQTIGQSLPEGFQRSEFLLEKGFVDKIVKRKNLKKVIGLLLQLHINDGNEEASVEGLNVAQKTLSKAGMLGRISKAGEKPEKSGDDLGGVSTFFKKIFHKKGDENKELSPWEIVQLSRDSKRPVATEYIKEIFEDFIQLHGDRLSEDDKAIVGGIGRIGGRAVTVIGQAKGRNTEENIKRNFGMPSPSGYRKALRLMKEAERFGRPIINIIDTPGAYCGISAEEQGQGEAIARNLMEMSSLKVPVLSIVIGEAGSGGALAMAVANEVYMMENSIYSILSPEGYASILWKDGKRASEAAAEMKLTAKDLLELGIIEDIITEPKDFSREKIKGVASAMAMRIKSFIERYDSMSGEELAAHRYDRFAAM